jgi:hypothetical protein
MRNAIRLERRVGARLEVRLLSALLLSVGGPLACLDSCEGLRSRALVAAEGSTSGPNRGDGGSPSSEPPADGAFPEPTYALSLAELQRRARRAAGSGTLPPELEELGGLGRIHGFLQEDDGEVVLLGDLAEREPAQHLDDWVVATRSAYHASGGGDLGCSIDLWVGQDDPWRIQKVRVFGMPPTARLAHHFVVLDYELKKVAAGLVVLSPQLVSVFDRQRTADYCGDAEQGRAEEVAHRFWFTPLYPQRPRFVADGPVTLIRRPVEVQLLTERQYHDAGGAPRGAAPPTPVAEDFASAVTALLASGGGGAYQALRNDFRLIELARLVRLRDVPAPALDYLLHEHPLARVETPSYVAQVRREDTVRAICGGTVTEERRNGTVRVRLVEAEHTHGLRFVGGVEAAVEVRHTDVAPPGDSRLASLATRVRRSRPAARTLFWEIARPK